MKVFAVKDHKVGIFMKPVFDHHAGSAIRGFEDVVRSGDSPFSRHPNDFTLFELGSFDENNGVFKCLEHPIELLSARQVVDLGKAGQIEMKGLN